MYEYLYWVAFAVMLIGLLFDRRILGGAVKFLFFFPMLVFLAFVVSATVDQFDIGTYKNIYNRLDVPPKQWQIDLFPEYGFQILNYLFNGVFGFPFEVFRFYFALASLLVLYFTVSKLTSKQGMYFLLYYPKYFLIGLMSHVRSGFVNPFIFLAIHWAVNRKFGYVFIMSVVLSQIHLSAVLLNIVSLLSIPKIRLIYILGAVPAALVFLYVFYPMVAGFMSAMELRQSGYFEAVENRNLFGIEFIRRLALLALCAYIVIMSATRSAVDDLIIKMFVLSVFVYIGFFEAKFIADRVGGMLGFVEPLVLIVFMKNNENLSNKTVSYLIVAAYAISDFLIRALVLGALPGHVPLGWI